MSILIVRERNPDLLTAISVLQTGTYTRLPTSITNAFKPPKRLTNRALLRTLRRLNQHLLFRLRCVDHLPPELIVEAVRDGKVYFGAGGEYGWKAQMTVVGFGEGDEARWWLTGIEWGWKSKGKETDDPGGAAVRRLSEEERTQILEGGKIDAPLIRLYNFLRELSRI
jgi:mediator of RNA polymerase II transcription subunit 14